jgi:hypothetical protein
LGAKGKSGAASAATLGPDATPEERAKAAASQASLAASALAGRDKYGLPVELDMDNYDNEDGGVLGSGGDVSSA